MYTSERKLSMEQAFEPGILTRLRPTPRKVALMRASRIGDFVCATPAFRALRAALPEAELTLIGLPWAEQLVARSHDLDRFVRFPGYPGIAEQLFDAREAVAFFHQMQAERFDLAIQMHGSGVYSTPCTLMLGARVTVGFIRPGDAPGRLAAAHPFIEGKHEVRQLLALTSFLGAPETGEALAFPLRPADEAAAAALLNGQRPPLLALHPWARDDLKRWPENCFAETAVKLLRRHGGTAVLIGSDEALAGAAALSRSITSHLNQVGGRVLDLTGQTSLPVLGAVLRRCALLVSNDSGPAHIAYAVHTPSVTIFGETRPEQWGPLGDGPHKIIDGGRHLGRVPVAEVVSAADAVLAGTSRTGVRQTEGGQSI